MNTPSHRRQVRKWLEEEEAESPGEEASPVGDAREAAVCAKAPVPPLTGREAPPPMASPAAKKKREPQRIEEEERRQLRSRLDGVKERLLQSRGTAGKPAGRGRPRAPIEVSSSPGYSPSPVGERRRTGNELQGLELPPLDAIPGEVGKHPNKDRSSRKRTKEKKKNHGGAPMKALADMATSGTTTGTLQSQLVVRAAEVAQQKRAKKKEKSRASGSKDPTKRLAKILTEAMQGKKKKKKKDKTTTVKKEKPKRPGGSDPSDSSESSSRTSRRSSSGGNSRRSSKRGSSSSEEDRLEPPLKKRSLQKPGSVLKMLVDHARQQLDQTSKLTLDQSEQDPTQGIRLASYFSIVLKGRITNMAIARELHLLAHSLDLLRAGQLDAMGDLLAGRFMSLHQASIDGHWNAAKFLELMPMDEVSAAGNAVVLQARKHAKLSAKVEHGDSSRWHASGPGRGGKGKPGWRADGDWNTDSKGKGKKGDKGKGKTKTTWKGNNMQGGEAEVPRSKEKVPEK